MIRNLNIDLRRLPGERWKLDDETARLARELSRVYIEDLGVPGETIALVSEVARNFVPSHLLAEMQSLADQARVPVEHAIVCNSYYDLIKSVIGCSAFAVDSPEGPLHARNLDWHTTDELLQRSTVVCRFHGAPAGDFVTVGWPGLVGAYSGMAPGRFSVTLNAVLSEDSPELALPVTFLLRTVLETAASYCDAVSMLAESTIPCDVLLLVTGVEAGEFCVIERTPKRSAIRDATRGRVIVTNDYLELDGQAEAADNEIFETSCSRFERLSSLLETRPDSLETSLEYLSDPAVLSGITVQQMAFRPRDGEVICRIPSYV
ncbi:MAG: C45 family peptidase [Planctomycetota bacterium]